MNVVYLVVLQDKEMFGEPDVGMAIVADEDVYAAEKRAESVGRNMEGEMRAAGRCRCVAFVRPVATDTSYRIGSLIRAARSA